MEQDFDREARAARRQRRAPFLKSFFANNRFVYGVGMLSTFVSSALSLPITYILQQLLDVAVSGTLQNLLYWVGVFVVYFVVDLLVSFVVRWSKNVFVRRAMVGYKRTAFRRILQKSIRSFSGETTARYISALTNDAASIETGYLLNSFKIVSHIIWFIGALAMMLFYNWRLTIVSLLLSALPIVLSLCFGGRLTKEEQRVSACNEGFVGMVKDLLSGFAVIKSFRAEKEVERLFDDSNGIIEQGKCRRRMTESLISIVASSAGGLVQLGVMFYGVYLCLQGQITVGVVLAFVQLMNYILIPVQELPTLFSSRRASASLIDKLADAVSENAVRAGQDVDKVLDESILLENVRFAYEAGHPILCGVSQRFEAGKSYAIVGGSGSGKTTLLNLLLGAFDSYEGSILYDGVELRSISGDSLCELLSIIQQNVFVFDSSVRENITMFRDFPNDAVERAISRAGLTSFIETHGNDYPCGENGCALSGGEKQRISIARCLLRGAPVLLMDEATAALDAATAFEVTSAILDVAGLTRIVVTHRLEEPLLRRFDEILVLRHGQIEERGTFDSLMANNGYFHSLYSVLN